METKQMERKKKNKNKRGLLMMEDIFFFFKLLKSNYNFYSLICFALEFFFAIFVIFLALIIPLISIMPNELVQYSSSDSEDDTFNLPLKKQKLQQPPPIILQKFSKIPLKITKKNRKNGILLNQELNEISFIYIQFVPDEKFLCKVNDTINIINQTLNTQVGINSNMTYIKNLCINPLTLNANTLHISLCYNFHMKKNELDNLTKNISTDSEIKKIKFPLSLKFENQVKLFPNEDKSKYFVAFVLDKSSRDIVQPIVDYINSHNLNVKKYDVNSLHTSIAEINTEIEIPIPSISLNTKEIRIDNDSLVITRGRSIKLISG